MNVEIDYKKTLREIGSIFQELCRIIEAIKSDFDTEKKQDPGLTMEIIDYHLAIVQKNRKMYQNWTDTNWALEKDIKSSLGYLSSFFREFDNPFLGSERWYQKINELIYKLSDKSKELDSLLEKMNDKK